MNAPSGSRSVRGAPGDDMRHVIDSAIFDLSFGSGSPHWPDELKLARIVETELMPVVNEVFDEHSRASGAARIDRLEVDLGSLAFDGSWRNLRERIREGLHAALAGSKPLSVDTPGAESSLHPDGSLPSTEFDLLEHFLRFGLLPQQAQLRDRRNMDVLLRDMVRVEPQRLVALIRDDVVGGLVMTRLVRQFPAVLVRQLVEALVVIDEQVMLKVIGQISGSAADAHKVAALTGDQVGSTIVGPGQTGEGSAVGAEVLDWRQAVPLFTQRVGDERLVFRQVRERLVGDEPFSLKADSARNTAAYAQEQNPVRDIKAPRRPLSGSERQFRAYDLYAALVDADEVIVGEWVPPAGVIDELARDHPQQFQRLLLELRSGVLSFSQIAPRLLDAELRRLLRAFVMPAAESASADRLRFLHSIDEHAGRAGSQRVFQLQVLQRLIDGALVDLEAIASDALSPAGQDVQGSRAPYESGGRRDRPDVGTKTQDGTPVDVQIARVKQLLRDYLGDGVVRSGWGLEALKRAARHSIGVEHRWFTELLRQALKSEKAIARLLGLLPERLLTRALYLLNPANHERVQCYADAMENVCIAAQTGIDAARITELKWRFCFQYQLAEKSRWEADLFVQQFADYLAVHLFSGTPASNTARFPVSKPQRFAEFLRQSLTAETEIVRVAGMDRRGIAASRFEVGEVPLSSGAGNRLIEPETAREARNANEAAEIRALFESGIWIANAGQILAAPYLTRLFGILGLVEEGAFRSVEMQTRAVHLLQFMVDGTSDTPEYGLILNKILCGLDKVGSVSARVLVTDVEREAIEGLLRGMVQNWQALGRTSVNGFRESFLQREGRLRLDSDGWHLAVDPKAFDMLLDRIPWSFSTVKNPWMSEVIYVDWR